jgi:HK97 family phage portal protein
MKLKLGASARAPAERSASLAELIALQGPGAPAWSGRDGVSMAHAGFRGNVIAYRCVQMIADAAASVPIIVCDENGRLSDHPLCRLLAAPNPDQTGVSLLEEVYGHLQIGGNAYLEVVGTPSDPLALYVLRPDRVRIELGDDGWPSAYVYKSADRSRRIVRRPDGTMPVLHLKLFNPLDDRYGQSPMQVAGNAIDLHNAATAWNKSLLDNAARPSGALIYRGTDGTPHLTGQQFDRLKEELSQAFQGPRNAGRPMVLDGGLDWKPMGLSPADMDFIRLKDGAARDIALAFGVPPMLLGIPGDNTYANYAQANLAFWRQTVLPLVGKAASMLSTTLGGSRTSLAPDITAVEALSETRTDRLDAILRADVLTDAEKRMALGYPATPGAVA